MAWTWTGYDHDAVHRFKDEKFWQTGRNKAEDRFWQTQIHGENLDRSNEEGKLFFTPSFSLEGEGQCPQSLLDPEPAHSEAATLTAVGDMFMASSEIICFKMNTSELYVFYL